VLEKRHVDQSIYKYNEENENSDDSRDTTKNVVMAERYLSQAMVPGKRLVRVEILTELLNSVINPESLGKQDLVND